MKETRTINLNGQVFHIDNDAYLSLSSYLQDIELRLSADERQEVMADLEARICELLQSTLFAKSQQVVTIDMINDLKQRIGAPSDFGENKRPKVRPQAGNQGCGRALGIALKIFLIICAMPMLFILLIVVFSLLMGLFGAGVGVAAFLPELLGSGWLAALIVILTAAVIILPIVMIIVPIVSYMRTRRGPKARFWWIIVIAWLLSLGGLVWAGIAHCETLEEPITLLRSFGLDDDDDWDDMAELQSETRLVEPFTAVDIKGAVAISLQQDSTAVVVRSNSPEKVHTTVTDGVLYVTVDDIRYSQTQLTIATPYLNAINAGGACKIKNSLLQLTDTLHLSLKGASEADLNLLAQAVEIDCAGASKLELQGYAESCRIDLKGAGTIDADDFQVQDMHIACAGASKAEIHVQRTLWAQAAGASRIEYKGNPTVEQSMAIGGSRIEQE